jgi:integrase
MSKEKMEKGSNLLHHIVSRPSNRVSNRVLSQAAGFMNFMSIVLVWARPFCRWMHDFSSGKNLNRHSKIPQHAQDDVHVLIKFLHSWNGTRKWCWSFKHFGFTDASLCGFGNVLCDKDFNILHAMAGIFSTRELRNVRYCGDMQHAEIFGALMFLAKHAKKFKDESVLLYTDNQADHFILRRWATSCPRLRSVLRCVASICAIFNMNLKTAHVRSEENLHADWLSRPEKHCFKLLGWCDELRLSSELPFDPAHPFSHPSILWSGFISVQTVKIVQGIALRLNTRRSYSSLMRTCAAIVGNLGFSSLRLPSEMNLVRAMISHLTTHKSTTLSNFIAAIKNNFDLQGILPRGRLFYKARRGLMQIFGAIDEVIHKVPLRRPHLLQIISYFLTNNEFGFALATCLNYWAALRISELLRLQWSDVKITHSFALVIVRVAKNHLRPKVCSISHNSVDKDSVPIRIAKYRSTSANSFSGKIFQFSRSTYDRAMKKACTSCGLPIGTSHSFRAGFITDASSIGIPNTTVALHTRHKSTLSLSDCNRPAATDLKKIAEAMMTSTN